MVKHCKNKESKWNRHVKSVARRHRGQSFKSIIKTAASTYHS